MPNMVTSVGQTPAEIIGLPPIASALVLNSGPVALVVDNSPDASLDPMVGCRIPPGETVSFPARDGLAVRLWAVAAGAGGKATVVIFDGDDDCEVEE